MLCNEVRMFPDSLLVSAPVPTESQEVGERPFPDRGLFVHLKGYTVSRLGITLSRHIMEQQRDYPGATGDFTGLLTQIALAAKVIAREVNKAGLVNILGFTGEKNV